MQAADELLGAMMRPVRPSQLKIPGGARTLVCRNFSYDVFDGSSDGSLKILPSSWLARYMPEHAHPPSSNR